MRQHLRRVDEEASRVAAAPARPSPATKDPAPQPPGAGPPAAPPHSLDHLLHRASNLARDFNDREIADSLDAHPAAYPPVQEQIAPAEAYEVALLDEPDAIVRAARAAGLPADGEASLRRLVTDAHDRVARANEADARRLREAEEKAGVPVGPLPLPPPPGADGPQRAVSPDVPRPAPPPRDDNPAVPTDPGPAPPDAGPTRGQPFPPLSPEIQRLQLLDALAFVDVQTRVSAAARDVRAEAEKRLPPPAQRKSMDDELLRWFQARVPPPDEPGEAIAPMRPQRPDPKRDPP